jgi:hypothetical protein
VDESTALSVMDHLRVEITSSGRIWRPHLGRG